MSKYNTTYVSFCESMRLQKSDIAKSSTYTEATIGNYWKNTRIPVSHIGEMIRNFNLDPVWYFQQTGDLKKHHGLNATAEYSSVSEPKPSYSPTRSPQQNLEQQIARLEAQNELLKEQLREKDKKIEVLVKENAQAEGKNHILQRYSLLFKAMAQKVGVKNLEGL